MPLLLSLIVLLAIIIFLGYFVVSKNQSKDEHVLSPVPDFLSITDNKEVSSLTLWLPILKNFFINNPKAPEISAKSAIVFDITTNKVLFQKNPKQKLPMASLTKIMTGIVSLENKKKDDKYEVFSSNLVGEDSMGLDVGEVLSLEELLYGLMLHSGNDAAEVLASNFNGGRKEFIRSMNNKARSLGISDTNFTNPTGLEGDGNQYTTVYDLTVITKYALDSFPLFGKIVSTFDYVIPQTFTHKEYFLENETNLLTSYPGVKGVKTGYTPEAGLCLVTYLDFSGHKIIAVILGSTNRRAEMIELLDYSLILEGIKPPPHG